MDATLIDQLSERQRQCLRLVYQNLEAKEIAQRLGLSPHTVTEHLRDARRILNVSRSMQAARILAEAEGDNRTVPKSNGIAAITVGDAGVEVPRALTSSAVQKLNRYQLSALQRLGLILAIAIGVVALAGALITAGEAITRVFRESGVNTATGRYRN